jgi:hypothetical protein
VPSSKSAAHDRTTGHDETRDMDHGGRESHGRQSGDDRYRHGDRPMDRRDHRDDRSGRSVPSSKWDWDTTTSDRVARDGRSRGKARPRSRDRNDDKPNKRSRGDGHTGSRHGRDTRGSNPRTEKPERKPDGGDINTRLGDANESYEKLTLELGDDDDFFKLDGDEGDANDGTKANAKDPEKTAEDDPRRLEMRTKQLGFGYNTLGYARYLGLVPKNRRSKDKDKHPRSPERAQVCSKRSFDGQVKKWRRLLHAWDPPVEDDEEVVVIPGSEGVNPGLEKKESDGNRDGDGDVEVGEAILDFENVDRLQPAAFGTETNASKSIYDDWEGGDDDFGDV